MMETKSSFSKRTTIKEKIFYFLLRESEKDLTITLDSIQAHLKDLGLSVTRMNVEKILDESERNDLIERFKCSKCKNEQKNENPTKNCEKCPYHRYRTNNPLLDKRRLAKYVIVLKEKGFFYARDLVNDILLSSSFIQEDLNGLLKRTKEEREKN